jgi:glycosidase
MNRIILTLIVFLFGSGLLMGQTVNLQHVEPPFWWKGFKNQELQVLVHGSNISTAEVTIEKGDVVLKSVDKVENPNYLFLNLHIPENTKQSSFLITFIRAGQVVAFYKYELKVRKNDSDQRVGFSSADVVYLLMPDRFSNGDTTNDIGKNMRQGIDRISPDGRHGGDLKGISRHIDYIEGLGATAVWINPVFENNMAIYSYHGYAITDYYKVDERLGTNDDYMSLTELAHKKGLKVIMDMVFNHCGSEHWWMADLPMKNWVSQWPEFTRTSYRSTNVTDPYVSDADSKQFGEGWFDKAMPDLNQRNPFLAKYLIQNSIWWIEHADLDGIRQDTHPYPYKDFMAEWCKAVLTEYPRFNIVGECWLTTPTGIAYWQKDATNSDNYNSNLPSVFDFALYDALRMGFNETEGWNTGIARLYEILCQDFIYPDPSNIMVFADNHDVNRYFDSQGDDIRKVKMAMAFVMTTRGIPQIYYGTEILLTTGKDKGDGSKRKDFPGGWANDTIDAFSGKGLTAQQKEMQDYIRTLLNWRKGNEVIHSGKMKHFVPRDGVYVYFRYSEKKTVMIAINNNEKEAKTLDRKRYSEFLGKFQKGKEVITGITYADLDTVSIPAKSAIIVELK